MARQSTIVRGLVDRYESSEALMRSYRAALRDLHTGRGLDFSVKGFSIETDPMFKHLGDHINSFFVRDENDGSIHLFERHLNPNRAVGGFIEFGSATALGSVVDNGAVIGSVRSQFGFLMPSTIGEEVRVHSGARVLGSNLRGTMIIMEDTTILKVNMTGELLVLGGGVIEGLEAYLRK